MPLTFCVKLGGSIAKFNTQDMKAKEKTPQKNTLFQLSRQQHMNATTLLSLAGTKKMKNKKNPTMYPEISAALPNMPNMCNSHREKTS